MRWTGEDEADIWCAVCEAKDSFTIDPLGRRVCDECGSHEVYTLIEMMDMVNAYMRMKAERKNPLYNVEEYT